jgi:hypothetical protein
MGIEERGEKRAGVWVERTYRHHAWSDKGKTPESVEASIHAGGGTRHNFIVAMNINGFLSCTYSFQGTYAFQLVRSDTTFVGRWLHCSFI